MNNEELRDRGVHAAALLEDELLQEALTAIRNEFMTAWKASPARDVEGRERIWMMIRIADKFEANLKSHMAEGKLAERILADEKGKIRQMFGR